MHNYIQMDPKYYIRTDKLVHIHLRTCVHQPRRVHDGAHVFQVPVQVQLVRLMPGWLGFFFGKVSAGRLLVRGRPRNANNMCNVASSCVLCPVCILRICFPCFVCAEGERRSTVTRSNRFFSNDKKKTELQYCLFCFGNAPILHPVGKIVLHGL